MGLADISTVKILEKLDIAAIVSERGHLHGPERPENTRNHEKRQRRRRPRPQHLSTASGFRTQGCRHPEHSGARPGVRLRIGMAGHLREKRPGAGGYFEADEFRFRGEPGLGRRP